MSNPAFDTLGAARKLKTAGIEAEQADTIVEVMRESANQLLTVEHFDAGFAKLHAQIGGQSNRIDSVQVQLQAQNDGLSGRIDSLQTQSQAQNDGLSGRIDSLQTQSQAQIDGLSGRIDTGDVVDDLRAGLRLTGFRAVSTPFGSRCGQISCGPN